MAKDKASVSGTGASYQYGISGRRPTLAADQASAIVAKINRPMVVSTSKTPSKKDKDEVKTPHLGVNENDDI